MLTCRDIVCSVHDCPSQQWRYGGNGGSAVLGRGGGNRIGLPIPDVRIQSNGKNSRASVATSRVRPWGTNACTAPPAGEVVLQLKTPYRDGTTHLVMTPLEFLQRLAGFLCRDPGSISFVSMACSPPTRPCVLRSCPGEADQATASSKEEGEGPRSLHAGPEELGAVTQTRLRHRHHHLSTVRRSLKHPRGH